LCICSTKGSTVGAPGDSFLDRNKQSKGKPLDTLMARCPQRLIYTDCKWG